jgi:hypothetical protein
MRKINRLSNDEPREYTHSTSICLGQSSYEGLREYCIENNVSRSYIIDSLVKSFLKHVEVPKHPRRKNKDV